MSPLVWIALLVVVGLMLILLEVFVPSGGVLGMLSVVALGAGIVTALMEKGAGVGMTVLAGTFIAVPAVLAVGFRWFPATPLGRRVLPQPPAEEDVLPDPTQRRRLRDLVGRRGRTRSELVPWGSVDVEGDSFEAVSDGGPIAGGAVVEVTGVQGRAVVVRLAPAPAPPAAPAVEVALPAERTPGEPLIPRRSTVLEEFDFEELRKNPDAPDPFDSPASPNQS